MKQPAHSKTGWDLQRPAVALPLLVLGSFLVFVAGTWLVPFVGRDEPRFAEASREMIERANYIVPFFNDAYRFDKPPLIYWLQVLSYQLFGQTEFAARLPSVICAALTVAVVYGLGRRLYGERTGALAAALFGSSLQVILLAKAAVADMPMVLCVAIACWAGWEVLGIDERSRLSAARRACWWGAWTLALALGFLAKGPVAWLPLIGLVAAAGVYGKLTPRFCTSLLFTLLAAAGLVLIWAWPALRMTHGAYLAVGIGEHVLERSFSVFEGHGLRGVAGYVVTLPFFFVSIFLSFFPGSLSLPWLFERRWQAMTGDSRGVYLLLGFAITFAVFTLVRTKLPHYILPGFPLLAILLAWQWLEAGRRVRTIALRTGIMALVVVLLSMLALPLAAPHMLGAQLAKMSRDALRPEMEFASVTYHEPSLVWYFRAHVRGFEEQLEIGQIASYMEREGARFCIVPTELLGVIDHPDRNTWRRFRATGWNLTKGEWLDLTVLVKEE